MIPDVPVPKDPKNSNSHYGSFFLSLYSVKWFFLQFNIFQTFAGRSNAYNLP